MKLANPFSVKEIGFFLIRLKSVYIYLYKWCPFSGFADIFVSFSFKGTAQGRTFGLRDRSFVPTDEPIPDNHLDLDDNLNRSHRFPPRNITRTKVQEVSEEALQFLTGPLSTILIPSFYTLVCLISVPINICAVVAFAVKIQPKKPAAIYMMNLACADLLFGVLLPFKIAYHFSSNNWVFGELMCRVVTAAFYWNMYCSVLIIACISVDRLLAVVYPIDSLSWRRPRNAIIACVAMWVLSFVGSVPLVLSNQTVYLSQLNVTTCHDVQQTHKLIGHYRIYFVIFFCTFFLLPFLTTAVSYTCVIWSLNRVPQGALGRSRRRTRALVMATTVLVIFVLCFLPTNILLITHYLQFSEGVEKIQDLPDGSYAAYLVFLCLGSLNCLLDPLVYYFGSSQCQRQLSSTVRCQKNSGNHSSSSSSQHSSSRAILKSRQPNNTQITSLDSFQDSQYKKLLV